MFCLKTSLSSDERKVNYIFDRSKIAFLIFFLIIIIANAYFVVIFYEVKQIAFKKSKNKTIDYHYLDQVCYSSFLFKIHTFFLFCRIDFSTLNQADFVTVWQKR